MQLNKLLRRNHTQTHEGGAAAVLTPLQQLRRSVLACLLWEDQFYESGQEIAARITTLAQQVETEALAALALEARNVQLLRHAPLLLLCELAKRGGSIVGRTIADTIQRPDELSEFLAIYWRNGKTPIAKQVKKGLAAALQKFDAYQLAKYNRKEAIRLRDVLFLVHATPKDEQQAALWQQLANDTLPAADTWEVNLSAGKDKKATFERLLQEGRLGYLALLRNLRNMTEAKVDIELIRSNILARKGAQKVLPFRYVAAARACPMLEPELDQALLATINSLPKLPGKTTVLVDISGSMDAPLSRKADMRRIDAACALASIISGDVRLFSFSNDIKEVPPRRGMAGIDALIKSQAHGSTELAKAVSHINQHVPHDRLIVITDEQAAPDRIPDPMVNHAYMINVASFKNGVGYGKWTHIDGFSEGVLRWLVEMENTMMLE